MSAPRTHRYMVAVAHSHIHLAAGERTTVRAEVGCDDDDDDPLEVLCVVVYGPTSPRYFPVGEQEVKS